jgi:hypothetical protein
LRGWPPFARQIETERTAKGAAWVGTMSYGLAAQLADEPGLTAPVIQIDERERYRDLGLAEPDFSRPGLIIDLARRVTGPELQTCFTQVTALPPIVRGDPPAASYAGFLVAGPTRDIAARGCLG